MLRPIRAGEKYSDPFDLYDENGQHWGQMRLAQYGGSTLLQVQVDKDGAGWQDFQSFVLLEDTLRFGVIGKRAKNASR